MPKQKKVSPPPSPVEHGIAEAVYQRTALGLQPLMVCLCGFSARASSWESVGAEFDEHLEESEEE